MVRAAAKNHANVAIVTSPARYDAVLEAVGDGGQVPDGLRAALAIEAFRHTAAYDARIAAELPARMAAAGVALPDEPGLPGSEDPFPPTPHDRPREGRDAALRREPPPARGPLPPRRGAAPPTARSRPAPPPLQGKPLSYNNVLDASAAAAIARALDGPACVIVKHTNPCGAAERGTLVEAWEAALAGDPVSAFGGVVALTRRGRRRDRPRPREHLPRGRRRAVVRAGRPGDPRREAEPPPRRGPLDREPAAAAGPARRDPLGRRRRPRDRARHAPDDPTTWQVATTRHPTDGERRDLHLAWRLVRGATSNAIVLVRDGALIGLGSGQTSRVDAARQAVEKACAIAGEARVRGAACASDAFYPFPDGVDVCLGAGVSAFVQPGGSMRDADVIAAAENAGATMLLTGVRHFRH